MASRALAGFLVAGLWACGSDDRGGEASPPAPASEFSAVERDVAPVARYQFVETPDGMAVEAVSDSQVQTVSCAVRTCVGLCDECAARACQAAGELGGACALVVSSCNDTCRCRDTLGDPTCGFPVCSLDRMICYVGDDAVPSSLDPLDPSPVRDGAPAGRPSESGSNATRPAE